MDLTSFARVLGGAKRLEGSGANRPTNVSRMTGTAVADSADGKVLVRLDAQVFSGDGSQYVELPTSVNVREGDLVYVDAVGADGKGKSLTVSGVPGGGDRQQEEINEAGTTATKYITDITDDGVWVTPEGAGPENGEAAATTSGWHISDVIELFRAGVSMLKAWVDGTTTKVRIGAETAGHIVLDPDGIDFMGAGYSVARIARRTGGAILSIGRAMLGAGQNAWLQAYTDSGAVYCGIGASHGLDEGSGMVARVEARAAAGVAQVFASGKSLTVADNDNDSLMGIYDVPMGHFGKLTRCRIDIAFGTATIPANDGTQLTLNFVNGGFDDAGYICAITPMNLTAGFDKCGWCVVNREAGAVRLGAWNNNSYAVTVNVGVIGVDSRYGTVV